mgnify:CR=1 FL=1
MRKENLNRESIRTLLVNDPKFAKKFNRIVAKIHFLHVTQARAAQTTASPETIAECREKALALLSGIIKDIVNLNDIYNKECMGYVEGLREIQTKWDLADEFYLTAVSLMSDDEAADAIAAAQL